MRSRWSAIWRFSAPISSGVTSSARAVKSRRFAWAASNSSCRPESRSVSHSVAWAVASNFTSICSST